jgi:hypothetical protein
MQNRILQSKLLEPGAGGFRHGQGVEELHLDARHCWCSRLARGELAQQPSTRERPFLPNDPRLDVQLFCDLVEREATEDMHLHNLCCPCVLRGELLQGRVQVQYIHACIWTRETGLLERHACKVPSPSLGSAPSGVVDEDIAHHACGEAEEMGPLLGEWLTTTGKALVGFVDQRRGLQGVGGPLSSHQAACDLLELLVQQLLHSLPRRRLGSEGGEERAGLLGTVLAPSVLVLSDLLRTLAVGALSVGHVDP